MDCSGEQISVLIESGEAAAQELSLFDSCNLFQSDSLPWLFQKLDPRAGRFHFIEIYERVDERCYLMSRPTGQQVMKKRQCRWAFEAFWVFEV